MTLVDTPGAESIFEHNDTTAMATIRDAEGALVVLSADAPLTAAERRLLDVVAEACLGHVLLAQPCGPPEHRRDRPGRVVRERCG
ncbi:MAG: hypothetical protein IPH38_11165 [Candidatus Microthrix sp.]|nr:hypothetical protein [Candidatus Microthrix sp.]